MKLEEIAAHLVTFAIILFLVVYFTSSLWHNLFISFFELTGALAYTFRYPVAAVIALFGLGAFVMRMGKR